MVFLPAVLGLVRDHIAGGKQHDRLCVYQLQFAVFDFPELTLVAGIEMDRLTK
jgi:hypothetical protein